VSDALIILALILANGLFSGAEIAIISVRKTRLRELVDAGRRRARAVLRLREQPERFLATVQVGITVVSAAAAAFGGEVFAERLAAGFRNVAALAPYARQLGFAVVVAVVSYLSLVLGELVPKSLALRAAERYSMFAAPVLLGLSFITRPLVWFLTASSNLILRIFKDKTSFTETRFSPDEIQEIVEEAARTGSLDPRTSEIASRALELRNLTAASVMVPEPNMIMLPRDATTEQLQKVLTRTMHTRLPVFDGSVDNITGYVSTKDMLLPALRGQRVQLDKLLRPIQSVPATTKATHLLQVMQNRRSSIAIVTNEQGGTVGLVTLEDLLEELVGDIFSEHDPQSETIRKEADGTFLVPGTLPVRDINRALDLHLPEGQEWVSIGGLCIALAGLIPETGARLTTENGTVLEVEDASPRRVRTVRIHPPPRTAPEEVEP
jgi:putative hemolysin